MTTTDKNRAKTNNSKASNNISNDQVKTYLEANKDFFLCNKNTLNKMQISPEKIGNVYDFTLLQSKLLQHKNQELTIKLDYATKLIKNVHTIMEHTHTIIQNILKANSKQALFATFYKSWRDIFGLEAVIFCIDNKQKDILLPSIYEKTKYTQIYCGKILPAESKNLFAKTDGIIKSAIISKCQQNKNEFLLIAIGSAKSSHFHDKLNTTAYSIIQEALQSKYSAISIAQ